MGEDLAAIEGANQPASSKGMRTGAKVGLACGGGLVAVLVSTLVVFIVFSYQFQTIRSNGPSMAPTLNSGDVFLGTRVRGDLSAVHRGDIVVFRPANGSQAEYIKRVIAGPGDRLKVSNAVVTVNGQQVSEPYLPEPWVWTNTWNNGAEDTVPANSFFVLGDNRNHSTDSRFLGYVTIDTVLVKASMRLSPRFGEKL